MKRDMDLIRQILIDLESTQTFDQKLNLTFDDHDANEVAYHIKILSEAGLIDAIN